MLYSPGRSNLYALLLNLARTRNGPSHPIVWKSYGLEDDLSTALVGFGCILLIFLFYMLSYTFMEFLHHLSLLLTIQTNLFINWQWQQIQMSQWIKAINNLKRGKISNITLRLYANSMKGNQSSQFFKFF
jgi:hypothetical protein